MGLIFRTYAICGKLGMQLHLLFTQSICDKYLNSRRDLNNFTVPNYKKKFKVNSIALKVFEVLEDEEWHCRGHEYKNTGCTQLAGSGGIKGLKDGNGDRPGIEIKSGNNFCVECNKTTRQDIWSGQFIIQSSSSSISKELQLKILRQYMYKDIVEQTIRPANHLTIDHRFPKLRWSDTYAEKDKTDMSANEINARFQLLKKSNGSASHNHLKSRACEKCSRDKKRGTGSWNKILLFWIM